MPGRLLLADRPLHGRRFSLRLELPLAGLARARDGARQRAAAAYERSSDRCSGCLARPSRGCPARTPTRAAREPFAPHRGVPRHERRLRPGASARVRVPAWNARARFPAASTLKLAVALAVLRAADGVPRTGVAARLAAARVAGALGQPGRERARGGLGGSTLAGSARRRRDAPLARPPRHDHVRRLRDERPPPAPGGDPDQARVPAGLRASANTRRRSTWRGCGVTSGRPPAGLGPLAREFPGGFTPADARYLLRLLGLVRDREARPVPRSGRRPAAQGRLDLDGAARRGARAVGRRRRARDGAHVDAARRRPVGGRPRRTPRPLDARPLRRLT